MPVAPSAVALRMPRDFPDRMSPILVKELRQGLRQPSFVVSFLSLQVLLCLVVLVAVLAGAGDARQSAQAGVAVSGFVFGLLGIVLLLVQPLRGLNAVAAEIKADTLDLLLLTRLNAWRVVSGKWLALMSQSAVLLVAALPYLVLRYYLGGMNLLGELLGLAALALVAAAATAALVGISACASLAARILIGVAYTGGMLWLILAGVVIVVLFREFGGSPFASGTGAVGAAELWQAAGVVSFTLVFLGWYFLSMGATWIAPLAENRSTAKRLAGAGALGILLFLPTGIDWVREICWAAVACLLVVDALCERPGATASVARRFDRLGAFAAPARRLLLPGWPSGVWFAGLLACVMLPLVWAGVLYGYPGYGGSIPLREIMVLLGALSFSALLMPALVRELLLRRVSDPFAGYLFAAIGLHVLGGAAMVIIEVTESEFVMVVLMMLYPPAGLMALEQGTNPVGLAVLAIPVCLVHGVLLVFMGSERQAARIGFIPPFRRQPRSKEPPHSCGGEDEQANEVEREAPGILQPSAPRQECRGSLPRSSPDVS